ncbi:MFS transporter [Paraburkholderia phenoliruptrix]|uniref:MFS transporter n=1 Tax=Paraburkholderia phenoliruptrix TaxID=252970 RepID=UPI002869A526|nr:MFS transporter [Paraburkholderia phenoliruptrix]WMY10879.1 MFS transporter [Paraburkholderia phenoliruptrix]
MSLSCNTSPSGKRPDLEKLYRRLNWRVLLVLLVCYFLACLDRQNISLAKLYMQADLGLSEAVYGLGAGIFFVGYVLFEVPSNLLLPKVGARKTISRILVLWGATSTAMMFVNSVPTFYFLRFMLGVFEAGFAPAMLFYLTYWYGKARMAMAVAVVLMAGPVSGVVGGPLAAWIITTFEGVHGLAGWQWMFLIEGAPSIMLGGIVWFVLADRPDTAAWLSSKERELLTAETQAPSVSHVSFKSVAVNPRIYLIAMAYFCLICGISTINFWLPSIIKANGVTDMMQIGLYSMLPNLAGAVGMFLAGRSSDRYQERRWHSAVPALIAGVCLAVATTSVGDLKVSLLAITISTLMMYASYSVFWAMPSEHLKGEGAAGGIALINTIGTTGAFFSPTIIGWATSVSGSLNAGLYVMVGLLVVGAFLLLMIKTPDREAAIALKTIYPRRTNG